MLAPSIPLVAFLLQAAPAESATRDTPRTNELRRIPVTAEHLATAFGSERAKVLLLRARDARLRRDSVITSYDARAHQRFSLGMSFKAIARDRLFLRHEVVTRVRWKRGVGAVVDVIGSRFVLPAVTGATADVDDTEVPGIPYYPGRDDFWFGVPAAIAQGENVMFIHPLAAGAEAYYRYEAGDSVLFRLPNGARVTLHELRVRPREPSWRLAVGSLWFEAASAQLVRAVYRLAAPLDMSGILTMDGLDRGAVAVMRRMLSPMRGTLRSIVVEHGLYEGRFWLPRMQMLDGEMQLNFARVPVRLEERFEYASVNGAIDSLPAIPPVSTPATDSARADSLGLTGDVRHAWLRQQADERRRAYTFVCRDGVTERTRSHSRHDDHLPVLVRMSCDEAALQTSSELPPSIFDDAEEMLSVEELDELRSMVGFGAQAGFAPQRPSLFYGPGYGLLRYNRVEGLSAGLGLRSELGAGLSLETRLQAGLADREPNGELALLRSDGERTLRIGGYRRLVAANDWGTPLSFGASLNALLFGRDEGIYYRALGAELEATGARDARFSWRLFAERHETAARETHFSLAHALHGLDFDHNIAADEGTLVGMATRLTRSWGTDPRAATLFGDLRLEGATGDFTFGRGALDLTLSRPLAGVLAGSITLGAGSAFGDVPAQRRYHLGGTQTVRGQDVGAAVGNAYWMARTELGATLTAIRPAIFHDVGWAGERSDWRDPGRPIRGAGVGLSVFDGLLRLDVARGLHPERRWTMHLLLDARF